MVDEHALAISVLTNVGAVLGVYVLVLLLLRYSRYYRFEKCPKCGEKLSRQRSKGDEKWIRVWSLGLLPVKRYRCHSCYWQGQAFEIKKEKLGKAPGHTVVADPEDFQ